MAYQVVSDFRLGMDRRKSRIGGPAGSLWTLQNAIINRGGEVESAKAFVPTYSLPAGQTFDLAAVNGQLYVFGSVASPTIPAGVNYQQLAHPDGVTQMTTVLSRDAMQGKLYVIAQFADGSTHHYFDGKLVRDWDAGRVLKYMTNNAGIAQHLAGLINATGVNFTAALTGVSSFTVTNTTPNNDFAVSLAAVNGGTVNDQTLTYVVTTAAAANVSKVITVTVGGTFDPGDKFSMNFDTGSKQEFFGYAGTPDPIGTIAFAHLNKMYSPGGLQLNFSATTHPETWQRSSQTQQGAGFVNITSQDAGLSSITGLEIYQGLMAIFGPLSVQTWTITDSISSNAFVQNLRGTGTTSPRSCKSFGAVDVFYLASSGIRSLRALVATNVAYASDIGSPMDPFIQAQLATLTSAQIAAACSEIEPVDERYWLAVNDTLYAFSYFPSAQISAWSYITPGIGQITAMARTRTQLWARSGDTIYCYGGTNNATYPAANVQAPYVDTPFFDKKAIATKVDLEGFAFGSTGTWNVYMLPDPNNDQIVIPVGQVTGSTYRQEQIDMEDETTHVAFRFQCVSGGDSKLTNLAFIYEDYASQQKGQ